LNAVAPILASALVAGSLYALVASGLSFVWGTVRIFNFAQGALLMLGAYTAFYVATPNEANLGIGAGLAAAVVVLALAGAVLYLAVVRPFVGREGADLIVIITTLASATILQDGVSKLAGANFKGLSHLANGTIQVFNTAVSYQEAIIIILGPSLLIALALFLKKGKVGMAIRAVEQNRDSAHLVGINIQRIYVVVFAISAALAGTAGVLYGGEFYLQPTMGSNTLLKAFIVVVFGGLGSLSGTVVGAYLIALIEATSNYYIGLYWTPCILFGILIAVLLARPTGLMGRAE
jgi:branched-chain amino acid transport system permease protein